MKTAGILLPISSLPGKYGIGTLGKEAYRFIDMLRETGQRMWQILPLGPTGFGDSPYQSFSAFAGNPYFVDLELLIEEGLLTEEDCEAFDFGDDEEQIDYEKIYEGRYAVLRIAYENWCAQKGNSVIGLLQQLKPETVAYCEFMAIKDRKKGASWDVWDDEFKLRDAKTMTAFRKECAKEIGFYAFIQMKFEEQWKALRGYATEKGVQLVGDIPIYVAFDSADAWANKELFQFDKLGRPTGVAGVPPDAFSATGQLWGNPLYDWPVHKKTGYAWWIKRMDYCFSLYDIVRVDHFRGFEAYYSVPYGEETAEKGSWVKGPGMELFEAMYRHFGTKELPIIAEDLGVITPEVEALIEETGFPGMKILQFAWGSGNQNAYLPHNFTSPNCVYYTGTHDNDTLKHWFETLPDWQRDYMYQYMSRSGNDWRAMPELLIKLVLGSVADRVIIPAADYLELGEEARINEPSTTGKNWKWRMKQGAFTTERKCLVAHLSGLYGRYYRMPEPVMEESETEPEAEEAKAEAEEKG